MRGLCKTGCGFELEYDHTEFSDGFVYYLPKNLDKTVHNCIFSDNILDVVDDEEALAEYGQKNKERLKISLNDY